MAEVLALTDSFKRKLALSSLDHDTAAANPKRALELLAQIKDPADRAAFIEGMMAAAAKMPPADAVLLAAELPSGADHDVGLRALANNWGVELNAPTTALMMRIRGNTAGLGTVLATLSPEKAIAWAEGLLDGEARQDVISDSVRVFAKNNLQSALNLALNMVDPVDRARALSGVAISWAETNPQAAFDYSVLLTDPEAKRQLQQTVLNPWSLKNRDQATQRAMTMPEAQQAGALVSMSRAMLQKDGVTTRQWAENLPPGNGKDAVLSDLNLNEGGVRIHNADGSTTLLILPTSDKK